MPDKMQKPIYLLSCSVVLLVLNNIFGSVESSPLVANAHHLRGAVFAVSDEGVKEREREFKRIKQGHNWSRLKCTLYPCVDGNLSPSLSLSL